jgi:hypothetical protein
MGHEVHPIVMFLWASMGLPGRMAGPSRPSRRRLLLFASRAALVFVGHSIHPSGDIQRFIIGKPE